jgi:SAM-dependent methyltransferase
VTGVGRRLFPATLILRDTLVLDRWRWLARRLPRTKGPARLLDVGCAAGAFSMGAALRGYDVLGLEHDPGSVAKARRRAAWLGVPHVRFEESDARRLGERADLRGAFDVVICCETIEHILDDAGLMRALAGCLKPGGRLLLTTPFAGFRAITREDDAPPSATEDGGHVRRGYAPADLERLCGQAGLQVVAFSGCSGVLSQKATWLYRRAGRRHPVLGALLVTPLRPFPPLLDAMATRALGWPYYCLGLEAVRGGGTP